MDFLTESLCAKALIKLVSRGSTIVAELLKMSTRIPKIFLHDGNENEMIQVQIMDFKYFKNEEYEEIEKKIAAREELLQKEEELREEYEAIVERFIILFENIIRYNQDLNIFIKEVEEEQFAETVDYQLTMDDSKQLLAEAYYYYGVMLFQCENLIPGKVRERFLVFHTRAQGGVNSVTNLHELCKQFKSTGFTPEWYPNMKNRTPIFNQPLPEPELSDKEKKKSKATIKKEKRHIQNILSRLKVDTNIIQKLIMNIKDEDIYKQQRAYPIPTTRSFALAPQGSVLFILLSFVPETLEQDTKLMREIVDKHFYDNWVVPIFTGYLVDLTWDWRFYKAAKTALRPNITEDMIEVWTTYYNDECKKTIDQLVNQILVEGVLTKEYVINNKDELMHVTRSINMSCRWLMLHRLTIQKELGEIVKSKTKVRMVLKLLLYGSQFELIFKKLAEDAVDERELYWGEAYQLVINYLTDIVTYYSGNTGFVMAVANNELAHWFNKILQLVKGLEQNKTAQSTQQIQQLTKSLNAIQGHESVEGNSQVVAYLNEIRVLLKRMMNAIHQRQKFLQDIMQITDCSYSSQLLREYIPHMQKAIQADSKATLMLRATFIKLTSIMNTPMVRQIQANSDEYKQVCLYYCGELVNFVKDVLQVIPKRIFEVISDIMKVLSKYPNIKDMPAIIDQKDVNQYALFEKRAVIAQCAAEIANHTNGVLSMEKYLIGIIEVVPFDILNEGLRKELRDMVSHKLENSLKFSNCENIDDFTRILKDVGSQLDSLQKTLEYIQDQLNLYGLKVWYDEFNTLIVAYTEIEWNYKKTKELPDEALSGWNSKTKDFDYDAGLCVPISNLKPDKNGSLTFIGRLGDALTNFASPQRTAWVEKYMSFYNLENRNPDITLATFEILRGAVGASGLYGIDKLLSHKITRELDSSHRNIELCNDNDCKDGKKEYNSLGSLNALIPDIDVIIKAYIRRNDAYLKNVIAKLERVGTLAILRRLILQELSIASRLSCQKFYMILENLNDSILNDTVNYKSYNNMSKLPDETINAENEFIDTISKLGHRLGQADPLLKTYHQPKPQDITPFILFAATCLYLPLVGYHPKLQCLFRKGQNQNDPIRLVYGISIALYQYADKATKQYFHYLAQYVKSQICTVEKNEKNKDYIIDKFKETFVYTKLYEEIAEMSGMEPEVTETLLPTDILTKFLVTRA